MSIRSGDIRDQSRKLSEIARNFLPSQILGKRAFQKLYQYYHLSLTRRRLEKFREDTPTSSEVIGAHTLNFRPNFKFPRLHFWDSYPRCGVR